jgi:asparagine N-glycosylation enzyme membrane subunit Stt3
MTTRAGGTVYYLVRGLARATSVLCLVAMALPYVRDGLTPSLFTSATSLIAIALNPVGITVGYLTAWKREGTGAAVSLGCAAVFALFDVTVRRGHYPLGMLAVLSTPAVLFAISARLAPRAAVYGSANAT